MPTSLEAIAKKAKDQPSYRFRDLSREINEELLRECWRKLNKRSAVGVDGVSYREYDGDLDSNLTDLIDRLKRGAYKAKLVRRHYIPKGNGKQRPLGIPSTEDKLLQYAVAQILSAIYEQDFFPCSYGYRPKVGAKDAVDDLQRNLNFGPFHWVVEADIRGFFDNIDHDHLVAMLEERIDDERFIRLIRKWLKAGVLDTDGQVLHPVTGSPQGGIVSPILANIYLHHVLVKWFEETVKHHCNGRATLCVYADDFVCAFENEVDARRFTKPSPSVWGDTVWKLPRKRPILSNSADTEVRQTELSSSWALSFAGRSPNRRASLMSNGQPPRQNSESPFKASPSGVRSFAI